MKRLQLLTLLLTGSILFSCGSSISDQEANAEGFTAIEKDLKEEFGKDAYYTDLVIMYEESIGMAVTATVTDSPESLKMEEWLNSQGEWKQNSDVTIELPEGTKATDFMFQLNDKINLKTLGKLVESAMKKFTAEKKIDNPRLDMAFIKFPDNGDLSKAQYVVKLEPENGGTSFSFYYELNGDFVEMN